MVKLNGVLPGEASQHLLAKFTHRSIMHKAVRVGMCQRATLMCLGKGAPLRAARSKCNALAGDKAT
jgi:hypothetical protein